MLPRLRFVVASLLIAFLPMVFLGAAGLSPASHSTTPAELARVSRPVVLGPSEYSETQYRQDRLALNYARRETELSKLRELANTPLSTWIAAPAGAEPESAATPVATVTTDGPAIVTVNAAPSPEKASEVTVSVTVSPTDKGAPEVKVQTSTPEAAKTAAPENKPAAAPESTGPAPANSSMNDAPRSSVSAMPSGQVFAALAPAKTEKAEAAATLPQLHVVVNHPKPRARIVRRRHRAPAPTPVVQSRPPFFELFAWLFEQKKPPAQQQPAAPARQQPQTRASVTPPPWTTPVRTASQP